LCLPVSATHIYCHANCISHNGDDAHKDSVPRFLFAHFVNRVSPIRQIFLLIFTSCIVTVLTYSFKLNPPHVSGRKTWKERCVMGDEDVDRWIILTWIWVLYLRREGLYSSGSRKRRIAEWDKITIWMTDQVKDIGANRRGLFYCIRIGLRNSSRSSVSLSQSSTELALWGVQSSAGLSIFAGVCCCIPHSSNVLPLRHSAHLRGNLSLWNFYIFLMKFAPLMLLFKEFDS